MGADNRQCVGQHLPVLHTNDHSLTHCTALKGLPKGQKVRIVEIGSGSGGTSEVVMAMLADLAERLELTYTDLSPQLVAYGQKTYGPRFPFAVFRQLDVEKNIEDQALSWLWLPWRYQALTLQLLASFYWLASSTVCSVIWQDLLEEDQPGDRQRAKLMNTACAGLSHWSVRYCVCNQCAACYTQHEPYAAAVQGPAA